MKPQLSKKRPQSKLPQLKLPPKRSLPNLIQMNLLMKFQSKKLQSRLPRKFLNKNLILTRNLKKKSSQLNQLFKSNNKLLPREKISKSELQDYLMMLPRKTSRNILTLFPRLNQSTSWPTETPEDPKDCVSLNSTTNKIWTWPLPITSVNIWEDGWTSSNPKREKKDKLLSDKDNNKQEEIVALFSSEIFPSKLLKTH